MKPSLKFAILTVASREMPKTYSNTQFMTEFRSLSLLTRGLVLDKFISRANREKFETLRHYFLLPGAESLSIACIPGSRAGRHSTVAICLHWSPIGRHPIAAWSFRMVTCHHYSLSLWLIILPTKSDFGVVLSTRPSLHPALTPRLPSLPRPPSGITAQRPVTRSRTRAVAADLFPVPDTLAPAQPPDQVTTQHNHPATPPSGILFY